MRRAGSSHMFGLAVVDGGLAGGVGVAADIVPSGGFPNEFNTGPSGSLTPVSGVLTVSVNGTVVEDQERTGAIVVNADNVTIRNCRLIYNGTSPVVASNGLNLLVEDCEIAVGENVGKTALEAFNYTARRCNLHGGENTVWAEGNVLIEDCYIHDPVPYNPIDDPHTDSIQIPQDADSIDLIHNTIYGSYIDEDNFGNSAVTVAETTQATNILIHNNLLAGGGAALRMPINPGGVTWTDNRFSTIFVATVGGFGPQTNGDLHTNSGNVYHETGEPIIP